MRDKRTLLKAMAIAALCFPVLLAMAGDTGVAPEVQARLDAMRAGIEANGWTFQVGPTTAMQMRMSERRGYRAELAPDHFRDHWAGGPENPAVPSWPVSYPSAYVGWTSSVKNQLDCGSCWAFSTIGNLEAAYLFETGAPQATLAGNGTINVSGSAPDLSEQQLDSCNPWGYNCEDGGNIAYDMLMPSHTGTGYYPGAVLESCFPYQDSDVACHFCSSPTYTPVTSWGYLIDDTSIPTVEAIKGAITTYGSVSAYVYADDYFDAYTGGVFNDHASGATNHAIVLCGWDDAKGAWLLKNSYGTDWGIGGFMWITYTSVRIGEGAAWAVSSGGCALSCTATAPATGTAGMAVSFQATATPSNCTGSPTFAWTFGDGGTSTSQNPAHTYASAGTFTWSMKSTVGGKTCSKGGSITISAPCSLTCTANADPSSGSAPLGIKFFATATPSNCTGTASYAWDFGDGSTSSLQNPDHIYASAGSYGWTMTATVQGVACSKSGSVTVTAPPCQLTCTASAAPDSGIAPLQVAFAATAAPTNCTGSVAFAWTFGDGGASSLQNPSHTFAAPGVYTWTLTASADGETCVQSGAVAVSAPPCSLTCSASALPASGTAPLPVAFASSATPLHCAGEVTFAWDFGDGGASADQNASHTYVSAGTFTWTLTVTVGGQMCTQTGQVTADAACSLDCSASAAPASGPAPLAVAFSSFATPAHCSGGLTYSWDFGDGETSSEQNPIHTYASPGTFSWTLTVTVGTVTCGKTGAVTVGRGLPGDANGDGAVSIGEVQQAINMFLGTQPPGNGVDCNSDGVVSIGEVQKVINAFLGMPSSC